MNQDSNGTGTQIAQKLSTLSGSTQINFDLPQFSHIELDETETVEALRKGRQEKFFRIQREEYNKKINEPVTYMTATAEDLYSAFIGIFAIADKKHEVKIKDLCCYFAKDARSLFDLSKGLLFMGPIGNGKTTLAKMFSANQNHSFRVVSMLDVSFDYKTNGEQGVKPYSINFKTAPNMYGNSEYGYCFDDVGTEEIPARHYGESKNVFAEILQLRYHNQHLVPFNSTHVTTNKTPEELESLYGSRCYDRMKEMFNVVLLENDSWRGRG